jgi:hypothetical protein
MAAPALFRDTADGGVKRYATGRETVMNIQGIEPLATGTAVALFDTVTAAVSMFAAVAADNDVVIGPSGNQIIIDNTTGSEEVRITGDFRVAGSEIIETDAEFQGDTTIGNEVTDTLTVNAISTFNTSATFGDSTTGADVFTFGGGGATEADVVLSDAFIASNMAFKTGADRTISLASQNLTVATTTSGSLNLTGADDVTVTIGTTAGDLFTVSNGTKLDLLVIDGNTGDVMFDTPTPLPSGNEALVTFYQDTADDPVITLSAGGVSETSILTGSTNPNGAVDAPRGSLYMLNTGSLYVKTTALPDQTWAQIGTTASSNLQAAYDAGNTIAMTTSRNLIFQTNETGASESSFVVETSANVDYLLADAVNDKLVLGTDGSIGIDANNDITMTGTTPLITAASANLTISTTTTGNVVLDGEDDVVVTTGTAAGDAFEVNSTMLYVDAANGVTGFGTASPATGDVVTISKAGDNLLRLVNTTDSAAVELLTGTDPSGITAQSGSLFMEYDGTTGTNNKLWLNQSAGGSGTTWTELGTATATLQDAYDDSSPATITMAVSKPLTFITNETATTESDFLVEQSGGLDYILADASADQLDLGDSGGVTLRFLGDVASNITFDGTTRSLTNDSTGSIALNTTGGTGDVRFQSGGNVTATGTDFTANMTGSIDLDADSTSYFDVEGGNLSLRTSDSGSAGGNILIDAVRNTTGGQITMTADAASSWDVADASLSLSTSGSTGGEIDITAAGTAGAVDINANGPLTMNAGGTSNLTVDDANLTISTTTAGDILLTTVDVASADIIFNSHGATYPLQYNDTTEVDLQAGGAFGTAGSTVSIVGALNALDDAITSGDVILTFNTAEANVAVGELLYLTASGTVGKADANAADKQRPIGFAYTAQATSGQPVDVIVAGECVIVTDFAAALQGEYIYMSGATAGALVTTPPSTAGDTVLRVGVLSAADAGVSDTKAVISFGEPTLL